MSTTYKEIHLVSTTELAIKAEDLFALEHLTEVQQEMLETLLSRFSGGSNAGGPVGLDITDDTQSPLQLPVVKLRQRMTTDPSCPETAKIGDLYATSGDLLDNPLTVIPVAIWNSNIKWEEGGGKNIECSSPDGKWGAINIACADCPDKPWRDNTKQACDNVLNAVVLTENLGLYQVRFSGTSYTAGRTLVRFARTLPNLWCRTFAICSSSRKNNKGEYFVFETKATGEEPTADVQKVAEYVCRSLAAAREGFLMDWYKRVKSGGSMPEQTETTGGVTTIGTEVLSSSAADDDPDFGEM